MSESFGPNPASQPGSDPERREDPRAEARSSADFGPQLVPLQVSAPPSAASPAGIPTRANPYVGPRAYEWGEKIYGRELETYKLANLLSAERIVLFYSPSGAGKTSLIHAALIPELQDRQYSVRTVARVNREPENPPAQLPDTYNRYIYSVLSWLENDYPQDEQIPEEELICMRLPDYLARRPRPADFNFEVFIFDQFEEILTLDATDQAAKHEFFEQIGDLLSDRTRWALFSMREDFKAALDPYVMPVPTRFSATFRLELLDVEAARQAMQGPAESAGVTFTKQAADTLIDDLRTVQVQNPDGTYRTQLGPFVEPVQLQVVCYRLWESLETGVDHIDPQHLARIKNVGQALADYYALRVAEVAKKAEVNERLIRRWFERELITEGGIRGQVLMGARTSRGLENVAIRLLEDAHLVRAEKRGNSIWYELSHDRLITPVRENNATWFAANLSLLQRQAALWNDEARPEGLLITGSGLADIRNWANQHITDLIPNELDYLAACNKAQKTADRERRRNQIMAGLAILVTLAAIISLLAWQSSLRDRNKAESSARQAIQAQSTADIASTQALDQKNRAEAASTQALEQKTTAEAASTQALEQKNLAGTASAHALEQKKTAEAASTEAVSQAFFAATAQADAEFQFDLVQQEHKNYISRQLAYASDQIAQTSPDLSLLLAVEALSTTHTVEAQTSLLNSLSTDRPLAFLHGNSQRIHDVAISPDNRLAASASWDGIYMWPAANPSGLLAPFYNQQSAARLAFSPDGRYLAALFCFDRIIVFDITQPEQPGQAYLLDNSSQNQCSQELSGDLVFSPDSTMLAASLNSTSVSLWDLAPRTAGTLGGISQTITLNGATSPIALLTFSPDGSLLASGENAGGVHLWDVRAGALAQPLLPESPLTNTITVLVFYTDTYSTSTNLGAIDSWGMLDSWDITQNESQGSPEETGIKNIVVLAYDVMTLIALDGNTVNIGNDPGAFHHLTGHTAPVTSVALSKDGSLVVSGSDNGEVILWGMNSQLLSGAPIQADLPASSLVYVQQGDTHTLVGGVPGYIARWDAVSRQPLEKQLLTLPLTITAQISVTPGSASFRPDGGLVTTGEDGSAYVWNPTSQEYTWLRPPDLPDVPYNQVIASPDGSKIAASYYETIWVWEVANSKILTHTQELNSVYFLSFSQDGSSLAYTTYYNMIIWNLVTGQKNEDIPAGSPSAFAFNLDEGPLAIGNYYGDIAFWDIQTSTWITTFQPVDFAVTPVQALAFSPDGSRLASATYDGSATVWNVGTGSGLFIAEASRSPITSLAINPGNNLLAVGDQVGNINLWDLTAEPPARQRLVGHTMQVDHLAFSPDGQRLASVSQDKSVRIWDLDGSQLGDPMIILQTKNIRPNASSQAISPDGSRVAIASLDTGIVRMYDISQDAPVPQILKAHQGSVYSLAYSQDGRLLATGGTDGWVNLWDAATGAPRHSFPVNVNTSVSAILFSPDDRMLVAASGLDIYRWNLADNTQIGGPLAGHNNTIISLAFNPDGSKLASQDGYGGIFLWDTHTGRLKWRVENTAYYYSYSGLTTLAFSPDGDTLASALSALSNAISLWDVDSGKAIGNLVGPRENITSLVYSPDGNTLIAGGEDSRIYFWQVSTQAWQALACQLAGRNLRWYEWDKFFSDTDRLYRPTCPANPIEYEDIAAGYADKIKLLVKTQDLSQAHTILQGVTGWVTSMGKPEPAGIFCSLDIPPALIQDLIPVCRLAARLTEDALKSAQYSLLIGDLDRARATLQEAARQAVANDAGQQAMSICNLASENQIYTEVASACRLAAQKYDQPSPESPNNNTPPSKPDPLILIKFYVLSEDAQKAAQVLQSAIRAALAANDTYLLGDLCTTGVQYHLQSVAQPACLSAAEAASDYLHQADYYALGGNTELAEARFALAVSDALETPDLNDDYQVCWLGSLDGFAATVYDACENAVKLANAKDLAHYQSGARNPAYYQQARGLAAVLSGKIKIQDAILDLQAYLDWFKVEGYADYDAFSREQIVEERQRWIDALNAGENPFDADTLFALRNP